MLQFCEPILSIRARTTLPALCCSPAAKQSNWLWAPQTLVPIEKIDRATPTVIDQRSEIAAGEKLYRCAAKICTQSSLHKICTQSSSPLLSTRRSDQDAEQQDADDARPESAQDLRRPAAPRYGYRHSAAPRRRLDAGRRRFARTFVLRRARGCRLKGLDAAFLEKAARHAAQTRGPLRTRCGARHRLHARPRPRLCERPRGTRRSCCARQ